MPWIPSKQRQQSSRSSNRKLRWSALRQRAANHGPGSPATETDRQTIAGNGVLTIACLPRLFVPTSASVCRLPGRSAWRPHCACCLSSHPPPRTPCCTCSAVCQRPCRKRISLDWLGGGSTRRFVVFRGFFRRIPKTHDERALENPQNVFTEKFTVRPNKLHRSAQRGAAFVFCPVRDFYFIFFLYIVYIGLHRGFSN